MAEDLSQILETGEFERIATGYEFTEGPVWHPDGYLLFTEITRWQIWKVVPGEEAELVRESTGRATGLTLDLQGRLIACEQDNRRVSRTEPDGTITPVAERWEGKRLNRPNDVVGRSDGSLYFTNRGSANFEPPERDIDYNGVYRIAPDGAVHEVVPRFHDPNGLAFSPDERILYLVNTRPDAYIAAFDVQPDGSVTNQRRFAEFPRDTEADTQPPGVPDGMKVDVEGRVYCTGPGGVWVFDRDGNKLGVISVPEVPVNIAWGEPDNRTLFVAARPTSVYRTRMKTPGTRIPRAG